jgi:DNA-binding response OmpR family regulator
VDPVELVESTAAGDGILHVGELEIRTEEGLVLVAGSALVLSMREFDLMVALARRRGSIISREDLYASVWGGDLRPGDRSVDVYVSKLRGKLRAAVPDRTYIHTHPGFGYRLQPEFSQPFYNSESQEEQTGRVYGQLDPQPPAR